MPVGPACPFASRESTQALHCSLFYPRCSTDAATMFLRVSSVPFLAESQVHTQPHPKLHSSATC